MILSNKGITKATDQTVRMSRLVCAFVVRKPPKTGFLASRPTYEIRQGSTNLRCYNTYCLKSSKNSLCYMYFYSALDDEKRLGLCAWTRMQKSVLRSWD